jgi:hypothetical protein
LRFYEDGSDIWFGDFEDADFFRIEQTDLYQRRMKPHGINSSEFLLLRSSSALRGHKLLIVEAKKALAARDTEDFHKNLAGIARQFMDSLQLAWGIWFGSHDGIVELPHSYTHLFERGRTVTFVLVIKNRKEDMLYIADTLKNRHLRKERRLLGFDVKVYNELQAIVAGLVIRESAS